ncbi:MAG: ArsR family transcriptional regulator [Candidatus Promineifilaceae bacterium]|nr:ArsR family transcriptional regulator [Candidatus Promineifilaceae bacterium]
MPAPVEQILASTTERFAIRLEPVISAFHSLVMLAKADHYSGLGDWIVRTAATMSPAERERHRLVMDAFFYAVAPRRSWPAFVAYVDHLAQEPAVALRDRALNHYCSLPRLDGRDEPPPAPAEILRSRESYLAFLEQRFETDKIDLGLESQAYGLLTDPAAMQTLVVSHLRHMWTAYLAGEWAAIRPMLQDAVEAFRALDYDPDDRAAIFETITNRSLDEIGWAEKILAAEQLIFIPSAHIGPYVGMMPLEGGLAMLFGARLPEGVSSGAPDLSRAEILVRLNALADDTRLRILRLVSTTGELRSQDIMERLELSQSAASRHLSQLTASGYLMARRCEGAKCYRLSADRIEDTLQAVRAYLGSGGAV